MADKVLRKEIITDTLSEKSNWYLFCLFSTRKSKTTNKTITIMNSIARFNHHVPSFFGNFQFDREINKFGNLISGTPSVNIVEHDSGFRIDVAAPGLPKEAFTLNLDQNKLTISAVQEKQERGEGERKNIPVRSLATHRLIVALPYRQPLIQSRSRQLMPMVSCRLTCPNAKRLNQSQPVRLRSANWC